MPMAKARNGFHTQVYDATGTYTGEFLDGRRHGQGVFEMNGFARYEGAFQDNSMEGEGVLELQSGRRYQGEWRESRQHGRGKYVWPDGCVHEGEYREGFKHGPGTFTWADGSRYEGEFADDLRTGKGVYWQSSGEMYEGEFLDGQFHGKGYFLSAGEEWSLEGSFVHQRPTRGVLSETPPAGLKWMEITSGLKWEDGGPALIKTGIELRLENLTEALSRKQTFSQDEWDKLKVPYLTKENYVKVEGGRYMRPTEPDRRKPTGDEIHSEALTQALAAARVEFSQEEVDSFKLGLTYSKYIKVGDVFFKPAKIPSRVSNVQYDLRCGPIDTRPKPKSIFEISDKSSTPNRRLLPGEDPTPPKKLKAWEM